MKKKEDKKFLVFLLIGGILGVLHWLNLISDTTAVVLFIILTLMFLGNELERKFDNLQEQIWDLENRMEDTNDNE